MATASDVTTSTRMRGRNRNSSILVRLVVVVCTALVVVALGSALAQASLELPEHVVAAAQREGSVTVYFATDQTSAESIASAFERAYGIRVEIYRAGFNQVYQRFQQEVTSGRVIADVIIGADISLFMQMIADGQLAEFEPPTGAELAEGHSNPHYSTFNIIASAVMWNTNLVSDDEAPTSWEDFLDPRWSGVLGMQDAAIMGPPLQWYYVMRDRLGLDYFRELGSLQFSFYTTYGELSSQLTAGAIDATPNMLAYYPVQLQEVGAPVDYVLLDPVYISPRAMGIASESPNPNAARLFVNYALSLEGQQILTQEAKAISAHPAVQEPDVPAYGTFEAVMFTHEDWVTFDETKEALAAEYNSFFK